MKKNYINWNNIIHWVKSIENKYKNEQVFYYGIPKGGMILAGFFEGMRPISDIDYFYRKSITLKKHIIIIDDIVDTGRTKQKYLEKYPECRFEAMIDKQNIKEHKNFGWVVFPWEDVKIDINENIERILQYYNLTNLNIYDIKTEFENILSNRRSYECKKKNNK